jgi:hypothetical protein
MRCISQGTPGRKKKQAAPDPQTESGRRTDGIAENLRTNGQDGLFPHRGIHGSLALAEERLDRRHGRRIQEKAHAGGVGGRLSGKVIHRGPQPSGNHRHISASADLLEDRRQLSRIVADPVQSDHLDAGQFQMLGDMGRVGIHQGAGTDLFSSSKYFGYHGGCCSKGQCTKKQANSAIRAIRVLAGDTSQGSFFI